jgi:hypothetical protein
MLSRIGAVLLIMTAGLYAWAHETGFVLRTPMAQALKSELLAKADERRVFRLIDAAIARDDPAEAEMYVDIATRMGLTPPPAVLEKLKTSLTPEAKLLRTAEEFAIASVSGAGVSEAAIAGAMGAEAGTSGDLRDIMLEGSKLAAGGAYDQVVLGLSVAGLALAHDTGDDDARAKAAGVWKVAHRSGLLQEDMRTKLIEALSEAVALDELKGVLAGLNFESREAADAALQPIAKKTRLAAIEPFLTAGSQLLSNTGAAEAVKIASIAKTPEELKALAQLSGEFGAITRGVVVLTGAKDVSNFKADQTIEEAVQINPVPVALWSAVLLAMMALGDFRLFGPMPRSRPAAPAKRMFRRMPVRPLHSLDGDADQRADR